MEVVADSSVLNLEEKKEMLKDLVSDEQMIDISEDKVDEMLNQLYTNNEYSGFLDKSYQKVSWLGEEQEEIISNILRKHNLVFYKKNIRKTLKEIHYIKFKSAEINERKSAINVEVENLNPDIVVRVKRKEAELYLNTKGKTPPSWFYDIFEGNIKYLKLLRKNENSSFLKYMFNLSDTDKHEKLIDCIHTMLEGRRNV